MGPIVRAHDFVPQINQSYVISERDFAKGFYLIISGLIKSLSSLITLRSIWLIIYLIIRRCMPV